MYYANRIFAALVFVALVTAAWLSIRFAAADREFRKNTPEGVARAAALRPGNRAYEALRALQLEYANQDATPVLERAAREHPMDSAPRIRLGLAAEANGDGARAEQWLLAAARVDRQFEPRWTLANFYFRQQRWDAFWSWIHDALEVSYGDRRLAFDLSWKAAGDPAVVLARAIPDNHDVLGAYLDYTVQQHREAVGPVAVRLARLQAAADTAHLESATDLLLEAGNVANAREVWSTLDGAAPGLITNGSFAREPRNHGFDWRLVEPPGASYTYIGHGERIQLSGRQPETCNLLRQYSIVEPGRRYRLTWEARVDQMEAPSGLIWNAGDSSAPLEIGTLIFTARSALVPVTLSYQRAPGRVRMEGFVDIRNVVLAADAGR